jgi:hypothetical protein
MTKYALPFELNLAKKISPSMKEEMVRLRQQGLSLRTIGAKFGVVHATVQYNIDDAYRERKAEAGKKRVYKTHVSNPSLSYWSRNKALREYILQKEKAHRLTDERYREEHNRKMRENKRTKEGIPFSKWRTYTVQDIENHISRIGNGAVK